MCGSPLRRSLHTHLVVAVVVVLWFLAVGVLARVAVLLCACLMCELVCVCVSEFECCLCNSDDGAWCGVLRMGADAACVLRRCACAANMCELRVEASSCACRCSGG